MPGVPGESPRAVADAIVVLGARVSAAGAASPALARRVELGVALFRAGLAPRLLLSGGGAGPLREAIVMRDIAIAGGVPPAALLIEPRSRNTVENAVGAARLLDAVGARAIILVTDRYHGPRARWLFAAAGLRVVELRTPPAAMSRTLALGSLEMLKLPLSLARLLLRR